jgi:hypothetical protein
MDLVEEGKGYLVFGSAECLDLLIASRFLSSKVIAGKTENNETLRAILPIELFESGILRSITTEGGNIDDENDLACIIFQRGMLAIRSLEWNLIK